MEEREGHVMCGRMFPFQDVGKTKSNDKISSVVWLFSSRHLGMNKFVNSFSLTSHLPLWDLEVMFPLFN